MPKFTGGIWSVILHEDSNGVKDCSNCTLPHINYDAVITKLKEVFQA